MKAVSVPIRLPGRIRHVKTVSYTHLDVYKRQGEKVDGLVRGGGRPSVAEPEQRIGCASRRGADHRQDDGQADCRELRPAETSGGGRRGWR